MIIDEKIKDELNTWKNNKEQSIYSQFEAKCKTLSDIANVEINPMQYYAQYESQKFAMPTFEELQTQLYKKISKKYPNLEFGMSGRLKSPASHYEKVIRKFIEGFEKDEFKPIEILDDYAMKIFVFTISHPIDKVSFDSEGVYIDSNEDEFRPSKNDCFEFDYNGSTLNIQVQEDEENTKSEETPYSITYKNIWIDNGIPYICTTQNDEQIVLPLSKAKKYKCSDKEDLVNYCADIQTLVEKFLNSKEFVTRKRKDYISKPKPSGYASRQVSFCNDSENLGLECQIRTYDMEKYNNWERTVGYKPKEARLSPNSLMMLPRFVLTTKFASGVKSYTMNEAECFEYLYGISLSEYYKQMKPTITKKDSKEIEEDYK